jgi:hypothetical protein
MTFRILAQLLFANGNPRSQDSTCMVLTSASPYFCGEDESSEPSTPCRFSWSRDCAKLKTLAVKPGLRPAKLPDIRAFFATVSLHTPTLHPSLLRRRCGVEEYSGTEPKGRGGRNQSSELLCGGSDQHAYVPVSHGHC